MSSESTMFDNPFRAGGELSKDADDIVDAIKTGKLSVLSNSDHLDFEVNSRDIKDETEDEDEEKRGEYLVPPLVCKNGVVAVQQVPVVNVKQEVFEDKKGKKNDCCVVL